MIKIGDFSNLAHVSVKALRHYARLGLLQPVWTDRYTGYRYYSLEQLPRLNRILALKDLGFSLGQISELLDADLPFERLCELFNRKQEELHLRLLDEQSRLDRVAERLRQIEQEGRLPDYEVTIRSVPELPVASLRLRLSALEELPRQSDKMRAAIQDWVSRSGLRSRGQWITLHHDLEYNGRSQDVEIGLVVEQPGKIRPTKASQAVHLGVLPAVSTMASVLLPLAIQPIPAAYTALFTWTERRSYHIAGPLRVLTLEDLSQKEPASAFTEIQLPVESALAHKQTLLTKLNRQEKDMDPQIVTLPAFKVIGMRYFGKNENQEISGLWGEANQRMGEIRHVASQNAYGVCIMLPDAPNGEFEYVAGLEVSQVEDVPDGMVVREVPAAQYAVFTHLGSLEKLPATYEYIYRTWIPQSGYQLTEGLDFELYNEDFKDFAPDSKFYIYVPIK